MVLQDNTYGITGQNLWYCEKGSAGISTEPFETSSNK